MMNDESRGVIEPRFEGETLEIGRFYWVPTVRGPLGGKLGQWPVLGPKHEDSEIIDFPYQHYHYDFRFFSDDAWNYIVRITTRSNGMSFPHSLPMSERPDLNPPIILGPVIYRRRKCYREMPEFTVRKITGIVRNWWLPKLEAAYRDQRLKPGLICPHRGASLRGLPVDQDDCVICPLHGLRWNIKTGELVPEGS